MRCVHLLSAPVRPPFPVSCPSLWLDFGFACGCFFLFFFCVQVATTALRLATGIGPFRGIVPHTSRCVLCGVSVRACVSVPVTHWQWTHVTLSGVACAGSEDVATGGMTPRARPSLSPRQSSLTTPYPTPSAVSRWASVSASPSFTPLPASHGFSMATSSATRPSPALVPRPSPMQARTNVWYPTASPRHAPVRHLQCLGTCMYLREIGYHTPSLIEIGGINESSYLRQFMS
jgi:hypothetical protein